MLRLIVQSALAGLLCVLATAGLAQEIRETWVFGRDGVQFDFRGGCADHDAAALWLFVRVRGPDNTADTVELWFVDVSPDGPSERLRVVSEEPAPHAFPVGCVVANGTRLGVWSTGANCCCTAFPSMVWNRSAKNWVAAGNIRSWRLRCIRAP